ncbi:MULTISPECIES: hypothetical protein [Arenibacter]|nr:MULTISPECIES: hypothetical protein [Arenibacter]
MERQMELETDIFGLCLNSAVKRPFYGTEKDYSFFKLDLNFADEIFG